MNLLQTEDPRKTARVVAIILISVLMLSSSFVVFVAPALAHAGPDYCGHSARWITVDGKLHKQVFVEELSGGDHRYKGAHFAYTGTGYTRISSWDYARAENCH